MEKIISFKMRVILQVCEVQVSFIPSSYGVLKSMEKY